MGEGGGRGGGGGEGGIDGRGRGRVRWEGEGEREMMQDVSGHQNVTLHYYPALLHVCAAFQECICTTLCSQEVM